MQDSKIYDDFVLIYGDAFKYVRGIPRKSIKLIMTSPPYNIGKEYEKKKKFDDYLYDMQKLIENLKNVLRDDGIVVWQVGNYIERRSNVTEIFPLDYYFTDIFISAGFRFLERVVWRFGHGLNATKKFSGRYETLLVFCKADYLPKHQIRRYNDIPNELKSKIVMNSWIEKIWNIPNVKSNHVEKYKHPCQFPIELVERVVYAYTEKNDVVLDPFAGVSSTLIATIKCGRKAIGIEIDMKYIKISKERHIKFLNNKLKIREMRDQKEIPITKGKTSIIPKEFDLYWREKKREEKEFILKNLAKFDKNSGDIPLHIIRQKLLKTLKSKTYSLIFVDLLECFNETRWYDIMNTIVENSLMKNNGNFLILVDGRRFIERETYKKFKEFTSTKFKLRGRVVIDGGNYTDTSYLMLLWFTASETYLWDLDNLRIPQKYPGKTHYSGKKKGTISGNKRGKNPSNYWGTETLNFHKKLYHTNSTDTVYEMVVKGFSSTGDSILLMNYGRDGHKMVKYALARGRKVVEVIPEYQEYMVNARKRTNFDDIKEAFSKYTL